jgi:DeoR/GlpR family transcriptional regulator of sugar metabolism
VSNATNTATNRTLRQREILDYVQTMTSVGAAELAEKFGRSLMTIHRDLDDLASRGLLRKFHGGVSALPTSVFESSSDFRLRRNLAAKEALAREAVQLVEPGMSLMLDDSTTVLALARLLTDAGNLTVITNYRQAIDILAESPDINLIVVGGCYSKTHDSFIGAPSQSGLDTYAVDIVFQSTSTMDSHMTYHQEQDIVSMKRTMLRAGTRRVLMMDSTKVGHTSLNRFVPVSDYSDVILTNDVAPEVVATISESAQVHLTH